MCFSGSATSALDRACNIITLKIDPSTFLKGLEYFVTYVLLRRSNNRRTVYVSEPGTIISQSQLFSGKVCNFIHKRVGKVYPRRKDNLEKL